MKFNLGRDSEARFGQDFEAKFYGEADVWLRFRSSSLVDILKLGWFKILNFKFSGDADVWLRFCS